MNPNLKLALIVFPFILFGCSKNQNSGGCEDSNTIVRTHNFNSGYYPHVMIYKDSDTIRFLKNRVDTVIFFAGPVKNTDEILPTQKGCGKEVFKAVMQSFKSAMGDSITLFYSVMLNYNLSIDQFEVSFRDTPFDQFAEYIVKCDSTVNVLGKSYCVRRMVTNNGQGLPYIYYAKDDGLVKMYVNNDIYERIP